MLRFATFALSAMTLASVLTGCGGGSPAATPTTTAASSPSATAPAWLAKSGAKTAPLTVTGTTQLVLDLPALQAMPRARLEVHEPFEKRQMSFDGVWLSDVLAAAGVPADATALKAHAVDDYQVTLRLTDLGKGQVLLADTAEGQPIPVAKGGPVRVIFADGSKTGRNEDLWIWSVDRLDLTR